MCSFWHIYLGGVHINKYGVITLNSNGVITLNSIAVLILPSDGCILSLQATRNQKHAWLNIYKRHS